MSERTWFNLHVYRCPDDQAEAAFAAIRAMELAHEYEDDQPRDQLNLRDRYVAREVPADVSFTLNVAKVLHEAAPGASFIAWTEAAGSNLGQLEAFVPRLGRYHIDCDAGGTALFTAALVEQIVGAVLSTGRPREEFLSLVQAATGQPWFSDWEQAKAEQEASRG
jgi:hypothetical protein